MAISLLILPRFCALKKLSSFFSTQNAVPQGNAFATSTQVKDLLSKFQAETEVNKRVCNANSVAIPQELRILLLRTVQVVQIWLAGCNCDFYCGKDWRGAAGCHWTERVYERGKWRKVHGFFTFNSSTSATSFATSHSSALRKTD
ncbi:MAG: hypothetical protein HDR34_06065 [Treponema sp.]|nr:hypothetical protein [Treponema sp.]